VRSTVVTVFAARKDRLGRVVRAIGLTRASTKIALANLGYTIQRFILIKQRTATA
jgi:hypothetical protein